MAYNRNKKQENDKFYTKQDTVKKVLSKIDIEKFDVVIEPSAGDGSFTKEIKHKNIISLDIEPEAEGIKRQDWLKFDGDGISGKILVVGNPPFGNQGTLALKFIRKSTEINVDTIAFILPKSFKKDSIKNKIPLLYHLVEEIDLEDDSFTLEGNSYKVPCVFQIWVRSDKERTQKLLKKTTNLFNFVKKNEDADFAFRRVGFYAGKHFKEIQDKSEQSHYFIKSNIDTEVLSNIIGGIKWDHNNTAGPRSIGKGELIEQVEKIYNTSI